VCGQHHAPAAFTPEKEPVPVVWEAGWAPEPVWIGSENLNLAGIRSQDLPARSELLYRPSYGGSVTEGSIMKKSWVKSWLITTWGSGVAVFVGGAPG
jgi:hypothetical protein